MFLYTYAHISIEALLENLEHGTWDPQWVSALPSESMTFLPYVFVPQNVAEDLKFDNFRFAHGGLAEVWG